MVSWQTNHGCTPDGIIGPSTWSAIAKAAPTCSTAKNRTSGYTLALQLLLGGNLTPDAIYGTRTKNAVAVFQDACKLSKDGICGPKTWNAMIVGTDVQPEPTPSRFKQPVDYKQGAKPWGPKMYSNHGDPKQTMANSGCGPTAMANIVATLKDPAQNPYTQLAEFAMAWGDRSYENGTNWSFFPHVQEYFNFSKMVKSSNLVALKACLNEGGYVVCSMGPGYWTTGGHFITAWKYDNNYVYCNDPASSKRTKQNLNDFMAQRKQFFCYYPDTASTVAEPKSEYQPSPKRGTKIVDISKYQPTVDYDALIGDTSLIILRAGYRGTGGGISKDQKYDLHASELQKRFVRTGVYFYSIATSEDRAREEVIFFRFFIL